MISVKELSTELQDAINALKTEKGLEDTGIVTRVGDGVAWIYGLSNCGFNETLQIETTDGKTVDAFALNLMEDEIGAVLLGSDAEVAAGSRVRLSGKVLEVPVGPALLGRVVDPLGRPLDGKGPVKASHFGLVERNAPGVIDRKSVHEPLMTGLVAIDALVPIGRGQRELIIGDRQTGKTAIELIHIALIAEAKDRLRKKDKSISEIAYDLGFENMSYFSRLFKKETGMLPTSYKNQFVN